MPRSFGALDESDPSRINISSSSSSRSSLTNRPFSHYFLHYSYYFFSKSNRKEKKYAAKNSDSNLENSSSDHDNDRDDDLSNVFDDFIRRRDRTIILLLRLSRIIELVPTLLKKLKMFNPLFFNIKKSQNYRSYVEVYELFFKI